MGLFGPTKGTSESAIKLIEEYLQELGLNPNVCLSDDDEEWATWPCQRGSAVIYVSVSKDEDPCGAIFILRSPIVGLPVAEKVEPLLRYCMEMPPTPSVTLSLRDDIINVISVCFREELDREKLDYMFSSVSGLADELDNELAEKFGCEMIGEE